MKSMTNSKLRCIVNDIFDKPNDINAVKTLYNHFKSAVFRLGSGIDEFSIKNSIGAVLEYIHSHTSKDCISLQTVNNTFYKTYRRFYNKTASQMKPSDVPELINIDYEDHLLDLSQLSKSELIKFWIFANINKFNFSKYKGKCLGSLNEILSKITIKSPQEDLNSCKISRYNLVSLYIVNHFGFEAYEDLCLFISKLGLYDPYLGKNSMDKDLHETLSKELVSTYIKKLEELDLKDLDVIESLLK